MKLWLVLTVFLTMVVLMTGAGASSAGIYFGHEKLSEALGQESSHQFNKDGSQIGDLFYAPSLNLKILANMRQTPGAAEVHENDAEVTYVVDGTAAVVTGGTVVDGRILRPGEIRGSAIEGGQTWHLSKGDLLVVPAGTPHWVKEAPQPVKKIEVVVSTGAGASSAVTYLDHEKLADALAKLSLDPGSRGPHLLDSPVQLAGGYRTRSGEVEVHEQETEVVYVLDGTSTMVTGGIVADANTVRPGEIRGPAIQGGETQRVSKGDLMIIPAGTPHWHKTVPQSIIYLTVKAPSKH